MTVSASHAHRSHVWASLALDVLRCWSAVDLMVGCLIEHRQEGTWMGCKMQYMHESSERQGKFVVFVSVGVVYPRGRNHLRAMKRTPSTVPTLTLPRALRESSHAGCACSLPASVS